MRSEFIVASIVGIYLVVTTLIGFLQSRKVTSASSMAINKLTPFQAATFLVGITLGGTTTYGVAGDTVKFGMTYLVWFPISVTLGSWLTGFLFSKAYHHMKGLTLPALLGQRFDERTRLVVMLSNMIYIIFVFVIGIYTLSMLIRAVSPSLTMLQAAVISFCVCIGTVAFSGILGASKTNMIHNVVLMAAFLLVFVVMYFVVGGYQMAFEEMAVILPLVDNNNLTFLSWISPIGLGWGVIGQILLAKAGRLGGISAVSNLAASCGTKKEAFLAFVYAGLISGGIAFLSCSVGVFTAAYLGNSIVDLPIYSAIGYAVGQYNPVISGIFLAALSAAIVSTFSSLSVSFSSIFVEDILKKLFQIPQSIERSLYPLSLIVVSLLCTVYVVVVGIEDIMPFVFSTAYPCTIPTTLVALFGIKNQKTTSKAAFWAILTGVSVSLIWGLVLDNPFGIQNIYIALLIPLCILGGDYLYQTVFTSYQELPLPPRD